MGSSQYFFYRYDFWIISLCYFAQIIIKGLGGARGAMVIVVGNGHDDTSSNPGQDWLHFT